MAILTKSIDYIAYKQILKRIKKLNISCNVNDSITLTVSEIKQISPNNTKIIICLLCNKCLKIFFRQLNTLTLEEISTNYNLCKWCKMAITNKNLYGAENAFASPEIKEKIRRKVLQKYNVEYISQAKEIKEKVKFTIQNKYGKQYTSTSQVPSIRAKQVKTLYINGTQKCSKQQKYFFDILSTEFNCKLNYPLSNLSLDIALIDEQINIEYNGSGHKLNIKLGSMTEQQFKHKEIKRSIIINKYNWKQIFIIAPHDKIKNYTDEEYIKIINIAIMYLLNTNHHWVKIYIEENIFETSVYIQTITNILNL